MRTAGDTLFVSTLVALFLTAATAMSEEFPPVVQTLLFGATVLCWLPAGIILAALMVFLLSRPVVFAGSVAMFLWDIATTPTR